jgi:hypothetical protein
MVGTSSSKKMAQCSIMKRTKGRKAGKIKREKDGQSFASVGLHKKDTTSDWLLVKCHCIGTKGLREVQL